MNKLFIMLLAIALVGCGSDYKVDSEGVPIAPMMVQFKAGDCLVKVYQAPLYVNYVAISDCPTTIETTVRYTSGKAMRSNSTIQVKKQLEQKIAELQKIKDDLE